MGLGYSLPGNQAVAAGWLSGVLRLRGLSFGGRGGRAGVKNFAGCVAALGRGVFETGSGFCVGWCAPGEGFDWGLDTFLIFFSFLSPKPFGNACGNSYTPCL